MLLVSAVFWLRSFFINGHGRPVVPDGHGPTDQQWTIIEPLFEEKRQLSRLSHAANLRKEMATLMNQWIEENSAAMLARWLREDRERESAEPSMAAPRPEGGQLSIGL